MNRLIQPERYVEWAGKTEGEMIDEIMESEKKKGKDKDPLSFTSIMNMIAKFEMKRMIEDLQRPSLYELMLKNKGKKIKIPKISSLPTDGRKNK